MAESRYQGGRIEGLAGGRFRERAFGIVIGLQNRNDEHPESGGPIIAVDHNVSEVRASVGSAKPGASGRTFGTVEPLGTLLSRLFSVGVESHAGKGFFQRTRKVIWNQWESMGEFGSLGGKERGES